MAKLKGTRRSSQMNQRKSFKNKKNDLVSTPSTSTIFKSSTFLENEGLDYLQTAAETLQSKFIKVQNDIDDQKFLNMIPYVNLSDVKTFGLLKKASHDKLKVSRKSTLRKRTKTSRARQTNVNTDAIIIVPSDDENDKTTSDDENDKTTSDDENYKTTSDDENDKATSDNENDKTTLDDENGKTPSDDEHDKTTSEANEFLGSINLQPTEKTPKKTPPKTKRLRNRKINLPNNTPPNKSIIISNTESDFENNRSPRKSKNVSFADDPKDSEDGAQKKSPRLRKLSKKPAQKTKDTRKSKRVSFTKPQPETEPCTVNDTDTESDEIVAPMHASTPRNPTKPTTADSVSDADSDVPDSQSPRVTMSQILNDEFFHSLISTATSPVRTKAAVKELAKSADLETPSIVVHSDDETAPTSSSKIIKKKSPRKRKSEWISNINYGKGKPTLKSSKPFKMRFGRNLKVAEYECDICNVAYIRNADLQLHILEQHFSRAQLKINVYRYNLPQHFIICKDENRYLERLGEHRKGKNIKDLVAKYAGEETADKYAESIQEEHSINLGVLNRSGVETDDKDIASNDGDTDGSDAIAISEDKEGSVDKEVGDDIISLDKEDSEDIISLDNEGSSNKDDDDESDLTLVEDKEGSDDVEITGDKQVNDKETSNAIEITDDKETSEDKEDSDSNSENNENSASTSTVAEVNSKTTSTKDINEIELSDEDDMEINGLTVIDNSEDSPPRIVKKPIRRKSIHNSKLTENNYSTEDDNLMSNVLETLNYELDNMKALRAAECSNSNKQTNQEIINDDKETGTSGTKRTSDADTSASKRVRFAAEKVALADDDSVCSDEVQSDATKSPDGSEVFHDANDSAQPDSDSAELELNDWNI